MFVRYSQLVFQLLAAIPRLYLFWWGKKLLRRGRIQRQTWCMGDGTLCRSLLNIASPYVHSRVDSNTFTMGNPMPESTLSLCQSRLFPPVREFGFGFWFILLGRLKILTIVSNVVCVRKVQWAAIISNVVCVCKVQSAGVPTTGGDSLLYLFWWEKITKRPNPKKNMVYGR